MDGPILVPLDGSRFGEQALPAALALARRTSAPVELVHVHEPPRYFGNAPMYDTRLDAERRRGMRERHARFAERLARESGAAVRATFRDGPVVETLRAYAEEAGAVLLVMTTHGRGGLSRAWFGSVAEGVVREVARPVLLVRPGTDPAHAAPMGGEAAGTGPLFQHVLLPLDGSAEAEVILEHLSVLGEPRAVEHTLLAAVAPLPALDPFPDLVPAVGGPGGQPTWEPALAALVTARHGDLARVADTLRRSGAVVHSEVVVHQQAARAILEYADAHPVDLIALATHGRGALGRLLMGNTADKVMRGALVPVLLYRPPA